MRLLPDDPAEYLRELGQRGDDPLDVASAALMLSALDHAGLSLDPYVGHLCEIAEQARNELRLSRHVEDGTKALTGLLAVCYGYDGDRLAYDDPKNADLISVIDRRRGLPVALGILYIHAARAAGFEASALQSPGHFLLRIRWRGSNAVIDPFNGGAPPEPQSPGAPSLPPLLPGDWLASQDVSDIDMLLRLNNNLKLRASQLGERARALEIVKRMVLIAPRRCELWLELAGLHEAEGALGASRRAFEACLKFAQPGTSHHNEAAFGLEGLKRRLN